MSIVHWRIRCDCVPEGGVLTARVGALRLKVSVAGDAMDTGPRSLGNYLLADDIVSCGVMVEVTA